jgi:hypothetical protein
MSILPGNRRYVHQHNLKMIYYYVYNFLAYAQLTTRPNKIKHGVYFFANRLAFFKQTDEFSGPSE